ncbi:MAG: DUF998 domain-containing protein [Anaerolineaceae bacterium]|nr:DUF998 domain-containing protein [Anaerolineaceae bacterium]
MNNKHLILPVYIILLLVMFILPYFSAEGYSILSNTTSQLGAQNTPNTWIMNITFGLLGLVCIWEALRYLENYWFQKILLIFFGVGLIFTAIFQHAPITEGVPYNLLEDQIHSVSASMVGFSFTLFSFSIAFIEKTNKRRIVALFMGFLATGFSLLMFSITDLTGVWQRLMFTASFAWIIFFFAGRKSTKSQLTQ